TQEDALDARRREVQGKIDNPEIKAALGDPARAGEPGPKHVEGLMALARTNAQRDALLAQLTARDPTPPAAHLNAHSDNAKTQKDRDAKRRAVARLLVALVDALPTEDEKKELNKPPKERPDPTAQLAYQRMLNIVGARAAALALDEQAQDL